MTYEELLVEIRMNRFSKSTRELLTRVTRDMAEYLDRWPGLETEVRTIIDRLADLGALMDTPNSPSPEEQFDLEGFGHFKECYSFSPSFVIKFCAERNPTLDESNLLTDAYTAGFDDLFLPTKYYQLPHPLTAAYLEVDDDDCEVYNEKEGRWVENTEWHDDSILTHICIQPRVLSAERRYPEHDADNIYNKPVDVECGTTPSAWELTRRDLNLPDDADRYDYRGLNGVCLLWAADFKNLYGVARLKAFAQFCEEYHVWDLHSENVGYTLPGKDGIAYPVILDWMSK